MQEEGSFKLRLKSGFELELNAPIDIPRVFAKILKGRLRVDILPEESAFILTLEGDAVLKVNYQVQTQINEIIRTIFGSNDVIVSDPPPFFFRQKFELKSDGLPGTEIGSPTFGLLPVWSGEKAPTLEGFGGLNVSLGLPKFTFQLPTSINDPLPPLEFYLINSSISFPELSGMDTINIIGHLHFTTEEDSSTWSFKFEPSLPGNIPLPEIIQFFLSQFTWGQGDLPDIEDLPNLMKLSQVELDWYRLFQGLLTDLDPEYFPDAFRAIIDGALSIPAGQNPPPLEHMFRMAFRAFQSEAEILFPQIWEVWFDMAPDDAVDKLVDIIQAIFVDLEPATFQLLIEKLFRNDGLDLDVFFQKLLLAGADQVDNRFEPFIKVWLQVLAAAITTLDPDEFANILLDLLKSAPDKLGEFRALTDLPIFRATGTVTTPAFNLPTGALLAGLGLQALVFAMDIQDELFTFLPPQTRKFYLHIFNPTIAPIKALFNLLYSSLEDIAEKKVGILRLFCALVTNAEGDEDAELILLKLGRLFPLGIIFALLAASSNLLRNPMPWWGLLFNSIEEDSELEVCRLPAPRKKEGSDPPVKYLIFSDTHRDAESDEQPYFEFGSIDHFRTNQELYCEILDYALEENYTVIEAGDCEELWFIRDFKTYQGPGNMLEEILETHEEVYTRLAQLRRMGRYFRTIGNHDSYLRTGEVFDLLESKLPGPDSDEEPEPFLYDYLIIDGVKTMGEYTLSDILPDIVDGMTADEKTETLINNLTTGRIGLDSAPYENKKPMIIAHGHQWDFWNCDKNSLVGKLISNSVAVPLDSIDDPFVDMGGIALGGSPVFDFADKFASLPIFNNFPSYQPACKLAHTIQHMPNKNRVLIDDHFYSETITALTGFLAMPLTFKDDGGMEHKWSEILDDPANSQDLFKRVTDHLLNHICIGHTHYPQSQPYFNIEGMLLGPLASVAQHIRSTMSDSVLGEMSLNVIKTHYFNSGTAGWMEGVIWAIEIDEHGQARQVYWTYDTKVDKPQYMDWELSPMDEEMREALDSKKAELVKYLDDIPGLFSAHIHELLKLSGIPFEAFLAYLDDILPEMEEDQTLLSGIPEDLQKILEQIQKLEQFVFRIYLSMLKRLTQSDQSPETFTVRVPLPDDIEEKLIQIQEFFRNIPCFTQIAGDQLEDRLVALACGWLLASQSLPIVGGMFNKAQGRTNLLETPDPTLWAVLALTTILPGPGNSGLPIESDVLIEENHLKIVVP